MTDENVNETEETMSENVPEEAAPEAARQGEPEPAGGAEPPGGEPATEEAEEAPEAVGDGPAAEAETPDAEAAAEAPEVQAEAEPPAAVAEPEPGGKKKRKRLPRSERRQRVKPKREHPAERKPITRLPKPEHARGRRQERQGTVVSAASDKTIVVRVDTVKIHPMYKKVIRRSTKLHAHDESNRAKIGDVVRIVETRPVSKLKRWRLQEVVQEAK
jgi:small subunit ribosomal protein S17